MSDITLILGVLKFLLFVWSVYRYFEQKKREKTLIDTVASLNQRLSKLEDVKKRKKLRH